MNIPKTLKVGGRTYTVLYPYTFTERTDLGGQTDHVTNTMRIADHANEELRARENIEETLIHELLHCVDAMYNSSELKEDAVERLANGLYQVLKDNNLLNCSNN